MNKLLQPNMYVKSVFDIDLLKLKDKGIDSIIVDIDNTLVSWNTKYATENVINWFKKVKNMGFKICIVSNATKTRVVKFNEEVKVLAIHRAIKPRKKAFLEAINKMDTQTFKTAMIGDQIFTDILGGNRVGLFTILVTPLSKKELILTKFIRKIEKIVLRDILEEGNR
ncbi:YqeG family HAD IIIA-type phosphatase [Caldisalinibacter kiritimatiensis]|uniref:Hydrolase, HAD subfamily IIIA n=1 Tax=Caldisalinibacter kiritimatiensis TaxID=1304284 RepID=R1CCU5_9FIRM|nr:YqeG family HAD IIIA-type phosphatase [Caldisalinibacter kiritimatiensis]EOD00115.1 Hydrolase, HAD subfamily IIIA [Caldisalinibacter kiritimatiensis]